MSQEMSITRLAEGEFGVELREGDVTTSHKVCVPATMVDDLGLGDVDQERLVRESMGFLLEREPATSILPEFGLDIIPRYFPEYSEEVVRRVQA
jgi:hypothetical protein